MRTALFVIFLSLLVVQARAEDWTTTTGKTYKDVRVLSHDAAYVTILHADGGGKVLLSALNPDLQKRFGYDSSKASSVVAAAKAADQENDQKLLAEKARIQQQEAAEADALAASQTTATRPRPVFPGSPLAIEPSGYDGADAGYGDYDDGFYGIDGGFGGYPGLGYGYGYGYRGYRIGMMRHHGMAGRHDLPGSSSARH